MVVGLSSSNSHYLFYCHRFNDSRNRYIKSIDIPMNLKVDRLLFGSPDLTDDQNNSLFLNVQKFIINSKCFILHQQYLVHLFLSSFFFFFNYFESNIFYIKHQITFFVLTSYTFCNLYQILLVSSIFFSP
jgi:hypothetical protein